MFRTLGRVDEISRDISNRRSNNGEILGLIERHVDVQMRGLFAVKVGRLISVAVCGCVVSQPNSQRKP
jgi:hypothetical protein